MVQNGHETKSVPFKTKLYVCCMLTEEGLKVGVQVQLHRAPAPPACPPGLPHPPRHAAMGFGCHMGGINPPACTAARQGSTSCQRVLPQ